MEKKIPLRAPHEIVKGPSPIYGHPVPDLGFWRKEVHISVPLATVLKELKEKYIKTITTEELW